MALVEAVQAGGGQVFVFSTRHQSGKQLQDFTGIAAILRFPMPELEEEDPAELLAKLEVSSWHHHLQWRAQALGVVVLHIVDGSDVCGNIR